jgi:acyl-CoA thioester hydrolase
MSENRFKSALHTVTENWIDFNGHMSMGYYPMLFEQMVGETVDALGLGHAYVLATNRSLFTVEAHLHFRRELRLSDRVYSVFHYVQHDQKKLVYAQELYHVDGWLSATFEVLTIHVDIATRRSAPFPAEVLASLNGLVTDVDKPSRPAYLGRSVGLIGKPA